MEIFGGFFFLLLFAQNEFTYYRQPLLELSFYMTNTYRYKIRIMRCLVASIIDNKIVLTFFLQIMF